MKLLYRLYQLCVVLPIGLVLTVLCALFTSVGSLFNASWWGYWPAHLWTRAIVRLLLLPVHVEGREHLDKNQSYVFVANHQGAADIFLIYGFLDRNFKWMMKRSLRKMPLVGFACEKARHIFVDRSSPSKIRATYESAREILSEGMSLVVFPEGARTFTGHMGIFRKGAFLLAHEINLPVVPLTINGSFDVLPRQRDFNFVDWHPLSLTIHAPIPPDSADADHVKKALQASYETIMQGLEPQYQGFVENADQ